MVYKRRWRQNELKLKKNVRPRRCCCGPPQLSEGLQSLEAPQEVCPAPSLLPADLSRPRPETELRHPEARHGQTPGRWHHWPLSPAQAGGFSVNFVFRPACPDQSPPAAAATTISRDLLLAWRGSTSPPTKASTVQPWPGGKKGLRLRASGLDFNWLSLQRQQIQDGLLQPEIDTRHWHWELLQDDSR